MASHGDVGGVDIPQSKQRNTIHLANHLRGRARGRTLPIFSSVFARYNYGGGNLPMVVNNTSSSHRCAFTINK